MLICPPGETIRTFHLKLVMFKISNVLPQLNLEEETSQKLTELLLLTASDYRKKEEREMFFEA
jgi:hypothetical protein